MKYVSFSLTQIYNEHETENVIYFTKNSFSSWEGTRMQLLLDKEFISISKERATIYSFLNVSLQEPLSAETLCRWRDDFTSEFIDIITFNNQELKNFFQALRTENISAIEQQEKDAYLATFYLFNNVGKIPAPPWESVYVTKDRSMFGEPVFQLRKMLASFGLQSIEENTQPEDHIAIELEFMCYLIHYTVAALEAGREDDYIRGLYCQIWLHREHFARWIHAFVSDIQSSGTSDFYKGIAILLQSFISEDYEYIKELKEGIENGSELNEQPNQ